MTDGLRRGNKLWEGSRMFLPQHKQALLNRKKEQQRVQKPELDEQKLEELDRMIRHAIANQRPVYLTYYDNGISHCLSGHLDHYDESNRELRIIDQSEQIHSLKITDIVEGSFY